MGLLSGGVKAKDRKEAGSRPLEGKKGGGARGGKC